MDIAADPDVIVIGGGAAGLASAVEAARYFEARGAAGRIRLLEKLPRTGKKLLMTGNGRCNLSHAGIKAEDYRFYGVRSKASPAARYSAVGTVLGGYGDTRDFFESLGLLCREDGDGRLYPYSNTSASVLDALRLELKRLGVEEICGCEAVSIKKAKPDGITVETSEGLVHGKKVIFAAGGVSGGADGGFSALAGTPHTITALAPALCPLKTDPDRTRAMKGLRVVCSARLMLGGGVLEYGGRAVYSGGEELAREYGEVQFNENALSGICIFNLSRSAAIYMDASTEGKRLEVSLDLAPEFSEERLMAYLESFRDIRGGAAAEDLLTGLVPKRVGLSLITESIGFSPSRPASHLNRRNIRELARLAKDWRFPVLGPGGWQHAQITCGGIPLSDLTEKLESRFLPGLYAAGEAIDADGLCGGYNLHWAWSSGRAAGAAAAEAALEARAGKE